MSLRGALVWLWALWCLGGLLAPVSAFAQPAGPGDPRKALTQYKIDSWQTEQGLPLNTVQALFQSRDGYLWVGTAGGLARFDGVRFTGFDASQAPDLSAQPVFGFMEDAEQNLWIGHSKGASRLRNGQFEAVIGVDLTGGRRVWAFAQAADGAVWAATENGLVRWHQGRTRLYQEADGLPTNRLRSLAFDKAGVLWIATSGGGLVSFAQERFVVLGPSQGFPHLQVRSVLADPEGGMWAATAGGGLAHVQDGRIKTYTTADGLPTDQLTALARDAQGALWIGTWGAGVSRYSGGRFSTVSTAGGLAGDQIWSVQVDREGSVWIGTWVGGMNRLRNRGFEVLGKPEGLSHDNVRAVVHARNGVAWVSTSGGGLNRIEGEHISSLRKRDGLPTDEVSSLMEDRSGALWIGTYTAGIARLQDGRLQLFGLSEGLPGVEIRAIYQDRQGTVWAGTQSGLARFTGQRFEAVRGEGAPRDGVLALLEDRSGSLWIGTAGEGLTRLREGRFSTFTKSDGLVSNWILALHEDADGTLWIGTNGEGLNRLRDGRLAGIRPADGLWDGGSQVILEDGRGNLWMSCNRGFYKVSRKELNAFADGQISKVSSTGFGPGDALRATTFAGGLQAAGAIDAKGHLWLPSASGLVIVNPSSLPGEAEPPVVRLESIVAQAKSLPTDQEVVLPPGSIPLSIRYTAMTLLNADRVKFRYRMDGLNDAWIDAGKSREAAFPALPHGRYQFRVAASTDGSRWAELATPLAVTVKPHVHQTLWFQWLVGLGLVAATALLFRLRTHTLRARQQDMERLVAQRTEELRLANEHLSRLSFIDSLTGLANRRRFDEALQAEWRRARRSRSPLAIVIADIDGFKRYNDLLGHPEGDRCLAAVAGVFARAVGRAGDLAARYGGEEFVVLLPFSDHTAALAVAEGLRAACEALAIPHPSSEVGPVVTISLGVAARVPSDNEGPEQLMAEADAALYRAKDEGRNRVALTTTDV